MSDLKFKTNVEVDYEGETSHVDIEWGVEIEAREWGVKSLILYVPEQTINVTFHIDDGEDTKDIEKTFRLTDVATDSPTDFGSIAPKVLAFDKGRWRLEFE